MFLPILSTDECPALDKIKIRMLSTGDPGEGEEWKQQNAVEMIRIAERSFGKKSIRISWNFSKVSTCVLILNYKIFGLRA